MLGIIAVGVVRESRNFSGHPFIFSALRGHLCDSTAFLFRFLNTPLNSLLTIFTAIGDVVRYCTNRTVTLVEDGGHGGKGKCSFNELYTRLREYFSMIMYKYLSAYRLCQTRVIQATYRAYTISCIISSALTPRQDQKWVERSHQP